MNRMSGNKDPYFFVLFIYPQHIQTNCTMKKNSFFKRRKKVSERKDTEKTVETPNVDFYGNDLDDVQEYHNPYLTVTEFFDQKDIDAKNLN